MVLLRCGSLGMASMIRLNVTSHQGASEGLAVVQVQVWASSKRSERSDQVKERTSCPLGLVKGDKKIRLCSFT